MSSLATAAVNCKLSGVGTDSGMINEVIDLREKNSKACWIESVTSLAADEERFSEEPKSADRVILRVSSLKSEYTSRTAPGLHRGPFNNVSEVHSIIEEAYLSIAARRNAGVESCRCRRQMSPSLTRSPLPARLDPGKNAVPSLMYTSGASVRTAFAARGSVTSTARSPPRERPTTSPYFFCVCCRKAKGSRRRSKATSPDGPGGNPGGGGVNARCSLVAPDWKTRKIVSAAAMAGLVGLDSDESGGEVEEAVEVDVRSVDAFVNTSMHLE